MPKIVATVNGKSIDVTRDGEPIGSHPCEHPEAYWHAIELVCRLHGAEAERFLVKVDQTGQHFGVVTRNP